MWTHLNRHKHLGIAHSYQKQWNITETFLQRPVQSMTKIFPNILSNKTCCHIISLTHQAVGHPAPTPVNRSYRRSNSCQKFFNTQFITHTSYETLFFTAGAWWQQCFHSVSWQCPVLFPEQLCQVYLLGHSCRLSNPPHPIFVQLLNTKTLHAKSIQHITSFLGFLTIFKLSATFSLQKNPFCSNL